MIDPGFILAVFLILITLPVVSILYMASKKAKERKKDMSRLSDTYQNEFLVGMQFPVRYASIARFKKVWKLFPWEDYGILSVKKEAITFYSKDNHKIVFSMGQLTLEWIGQKYWPNGVIAWFVIQYGNTDHYFTSETGKWAVTSEATTKEIFKKIKETVKQSQ